MRSPSSSSADSKGPRKNKTSFSVVDAPLRQTWILSLGIGETRYKRLFGQLCERHGLTVTVAHYPSGASKWNPIEHRLLSQISKNWAGRPLDSYDTILNYIRTTRTATGLRLRAHLVRKHYEKGAKIPDKVMRALPIAKDPALPRWNYVISPS